MEETPFWKALEEEYSDYCRDLTKHENWDDILDPSEWFTQVFIPDLAHRISRR